MQSIILCLLLFMLAAQIGYSWVWGSGKYKWLQNCNGHGTAVFAEKRCICDEGYGADSDVSIAKSSRCDVRICPPGPSKFDLPSSTTQAHKIAECSDAGKCDRTNGVCLCYPGYGGKACEKMICPNSCSGHGKCLYMRLLASDDSAFPLTNSTEFSYGNPSTLATTTWDQDTGYGCVCDSSWVVGLGSGETQLAEWFGADCSLKRCPSGDDPLTSIDDTNCEGKSKNGASMSHPKGASGNLCHVECSNRGTCDYKSGICSCFKGYVGSSCETIDARASDTGD